MLPPFERAEASLLQSSVVGPQIWLVDSEALNRVRRPHGYADP